MKPSTVLPLDTREEPSIAEPFTKFRAAEKDLVRIYETFKVSYSILTFSTKLLGFSKNPLEFSNKL